MAGTGAGGTGTLTPRDYLTSLGHAELANQFQDDAALLATLAQRAQQYEQNRQLLPYAQQYAQHAPEFQKFLEQKRAEEAKAAEAAQKKNYFGLPEFDPRWMQMVESDPQTGDYRLKPGAPPDLLQKIHAYSSKLRDFQDNLWRNPQEALGPLVQDLARAEAEKLIQSQLGGYREQVQIEQFISSNSGWLHARDAQGQLQVNPATGKPALSPAGQIFANYCTQLHQSGIRDYQQQQTLALAMTQRDVFAAQLQKTPAAAAGTPTAPSPTAVAQADANAAFLAAHNRGANRLPAAPGAVPPSVEAGTTPNPRQGMSLRDRMHADFKAANVTDQDIAASFARN